MKLKQTLKYKIIPFLMGALSVFSCSESLDSDSVNSCEKNHVGTVFGQIGWEHRIKGNTVSDNTKMKDLKLDLVLYDECVMRYSDHLKYGKTDKYWNIVEINTMTSDTAIFKEKFYPFYRGEMTVFEFMKIFYSIYGGDKPLPAWAVNFHGSEKLHDARNISIQELEFVARYQQSNEEAQSARNFMQKTK